MYCLSARGSGKTQISLIIKDLPRGSADRDDYIEFRLKGSEFTTRCAVNQYDYEYGEDECVTLQTHSRGEGINVVFVGESFDAKSIASGEYLALVREQVKYFFGIEPFSTYSDYFDIKCCISLSQEAGVNTGNTWRNTRFGVYYANKGESSSGTLDLHDPDAVFDYVGRRAGISSGNMWKTLVVMTLNSDEYGSNSVITQSGAAIAVVGRSTDPYPMDSRGMMQREACGIAFGKLGSERMNRVSYLSKAERSTLQSMNARGWYMNLSLSGSLNEVWWHDYIFNPVYGGSVDVFEGGMGVTRGCFRSEINSCMNYGIPYFSLAARYDIVKRIKTYAGESFSEDEFRRLDTDEWGDTGLTRSYGDYSHPRVSYNNTTRFYKSKKY